VQYEEAQALCPEISFRFVRAGHILGSSMAEITLQTNGKSRRLLFTGDIGRVRERDVTPGEVVRSGPTEGETADVLVMESTYGNRQHPTADPRPELASLIRATAERGGSIVVPAFAVERTQKFLFMLKELMQAGQLPAIPVFCDSPMAIKAVEIFMKHTEEYSEDTRRLVGQHGSPLTWPGFTFASTAEQSKRSTPLELHRLSFLQAAWSLADAFCITWRKGCLIRKPPSSLSASRRQELADSPSRVALAK
jgi:metallo-beta-lactamase family protein